jgi:hypothetical protein
LKKNKDNNLDKRRYIISELATKRSPKTLMIAKVTHADDKDAKETMIIGMYVPTRFQSTTKEPNNDIPGRPALPSIKLEHRDAPVGFYL